LELDAQLMNRDATGSNVIHVGTLSKVLVPGLRIGWAIAPEPVIEKLVQAKQAVDLHTSTLSQYLAMELVRRGALEELLPTLRQVYRARRDAMLTALERYFPTEVSWTRPAGGMFLMVTLPERLNASAVLRRALQHQVAFVPGADFHLSGGENTLRLNFSYVRPEIIEHGVQRLGNVLKEMLNEQGG